MLAQPVGQELPAFPVVFGAAVFDRADGILLDPLGVDFHQRGGVDLLAVDGIPLLLGVVELRGGRVQGDEGLLARLVAGLADGLDDHVEGLLVALQVGSETAFVADVRGELLPVEHLLEVVKHLAAATDGVGEANRSPRA